MKFSVKEKDLTLRERIKRYKKRALTIEHYLLMNPNDWGKFQTEFNLEVNKVFQDLVNFEKENLKSNQEEKIYKLKRVFINKLRDVFVRGRYIEWSLRKPFGYAGDFRIIEDIYENNPQTIGFDRLFDNYFQMSAISTAVRNRKDDFKRLLIRFIKDRPNQQLRIMNLAAGPSREIREMLFQNKDICKNVVFDCYDNDQNAIDFSSVSLSEFPNVNFIKVNAVRLALKNDIHAQIKQKYDIIYSTGLFDYFEEKLSLRLIQNFKKLLHKEGVLLISDVRDKFSNPSVHFMEWVGDWNLVYRDDDSFRNIFVKAGYKLSDLEALYEQQGILQYIIAH
jgi:SAM-dependent methyltransferase